MTTEAVVDWGRAQLTKGASNAKEADRRRVIRVPREHSHRCHPMTWAEIELAAASGEFGAEMWLIYGNDTAPAGTTYLREGGRQEHMLRGRALIFSQGWSALDE
jgi:hypothetical protein